MVGYRLDHLYADVDHRSRRGTDRIVYAAHIAEFTVQSVTDQRRRLTAVGSSRIYVTDVYRARAGSPQADTVCYG